MQWIIILAGLSPILMNGISAHDHSSHTHQNTDPPNFPFMVYIQIQADGNQTSFCGGSLIAPDVILTGATCVTRNRKAVHPDDITVFAQMPTENAKVESHIASEVILHPDYQANMKSVNLAIVKLNGSFCTCSALHAIDLPPMDLHLNKSTEGVAIGWGESVMENPSYIVDNSQCYEQYSDIYNEETSFCVDAESCLIDRGSAFVVSNQTMDGEPIIYGIAFGVGLCRDKDPEMFTLIPPHSDWIKEHIKVINATNSTQTPNKPGGATGILAQPAVILLTGICSIRAKFANA